jgi:hypothetical protein
MSYNDILSGLYSLNETELRSLNTAVIDQLKHLRDAESARKRRILSEGDRVSFSGRHGHFEGNIVRVKRKKALVNVNGQTWNVPLNMLNEV